MDLYAEEMRQKRDAQADADLAKLEIIGRKAMDLVEALLDGRAAIVVSREMPVRLSTNAVSEPATIIRLRMDPQS